MSDIADTLAERGKRYGSFDKHAALAQDLKRVMRAVEQWWTLADDQREALEMIQHKIARILNGDSNYADNWHDIAGYAKLVDDRLSALLLVVPGLASPAPQAKTIPPPATVVPTPNGGEHHYYPSLGDAVKRVGGGRRAKKKPVG